MGCAVEVQNPTTIAGGFVLAHMAGLMAAWRLGRGRLVTRAYLALLEIRARRCRIDPGRLAACSHAELAGLLGVTARKARALVRRLEAAGLVTWEAGLPVFPEPVLADLEALRDTIGGGMGPLMIPRRMLRFLAGGARPSLIATALGTILRCLSRRRGGFDGRGRLKAAWIATTFGVAPSRVKAARKELVALGWIAPEPGDQWALNRWGRAFRISLDWAAPAGSPSGPLTADPDPPLGPLASDAGTSLGPPDLHRDLPSGDENDQEPAPGGPAGAWLGDRRPEPPEASPGVVAVLPIPARSASSATSRPDPAPVRSPAAGPVAPVPATMPTGRATGSPRVRPSSRPAPAPPLVPAAPPAPAAPPRLGDVRVDDLKDTGRLLELHRQAVARGMIPDSEADRLRLVGAAEHALAVGRSNPAGLFAHLIRGRLWRYLTQVDEDRAVARLKSLGRAAAADREPPARWGRSLLSEIPVGSAAAATAGPWAWPPGRGPSRPAAAAPAGDVEVVRAVRAAAIGAGVFRDPFPEFVRRYPDWSRERWDRAVELATRAGPPAR